MSTFEVRRLTDRQTIAKVLEACAAAEFRCTRIQLNVPDLGTFDIPVSEDGVLSGLTPALFVANSDGVLVNQFEFSVASRQIALAGLIKVSRPPKQPLDSVNLNGVMSAQSQAPDAVEHKLNLFTAAKETLKAVDRPTWAAEVLSDEQRKFFEAKEEVLSRLEQTHQKLVFDQAEWRKQLESEFENRRAEMESDYQSKTEDLNSREMELEKRKKDVDDRSRMHARRETRLDLKNQFKTKLSGFALSPSTNSKRRPTVWLLTAMLIVFGGLFTWSVVSTLLSNSIDIPIAVRQVLIGILFGATAIYFLKWNNNWLREHSEEEFNLMRQDLDIDRASWLVELYAETAGEKAILPEVVVDRLSAGLFERKNVASTNHPVESLAETILGAATKAKVKTPTGEVEFDRKALRSLDSSQ